MPLVSSIQHYIILQTHKMRSSETCKRSVSLFSHFTNNAGPVGCSLGISQRDQIPYSVRLLRLLLCFDLAGAAVVAAGAAAGQQPRGSSHNADGSAKKALTQQGKVHSQRVILAPLLPNSPFTSAEPGFKGPLPLSVKPSSEVQLGRTAWV